jgi:peptidoglycan recognition protein
MILACPRIVSRAEWGARPPLEEIYQAVPVPYVVIHHGASAPCFDQASCSSMVQVYQNLHMDTNGWPDIGYNFLVGEDGNVYEGRGWDKVGAHAPGYNFNSIGVCFIGTFTGKIIDLLYIFITMFI